MNTSVLDLTIEELKKIENLSVRSYNVCRRYNLQTLEKIILFYKEHGGFSLLQNCGIRSGQELILICEKYKHQLYTSLIETDTYEESNILYQKIQSLSIQQRSILNSLVYIKVSELSTRAYNALSVCLKNNFTITNFYDQIFSVKEFSFNNLKNVGRKSVQELVHLQADILEFIDLVAAFESEQECIEEYVRLLLIRKFNMRTTHFSEIHSVFLKIGKIPLFKLLHVLIINDYIFDVNKTLIFLNCFNYFDSFNYITLDKIGDTLSITRERVRQLREKIYENFVDYFDIIKNIDTQQFYLYEIDLKQNYIEIDNTLLAKINQTEKTNFNLLFLNKILSIIVNKTHLLVGNERDSIFNTSNRNTHNWNETYLISKELINIFDFEKFIENVSFRLRERIEDTYSFNFQPYLLDFYKFDKWQNLELISDICEKILFKEFSITLNAENNIVFERNASKSITKYIVEILEVKGSPLSIYEIYEILNEYHPKLCKSVEALRGSCQRIIGEKLIYFGRSSTFGLKEWENSNNGIKGGTIRDIAEEYLIQFDEPKHILEIAKHIIQFRPTTNSNSILQNLKAEQNNRFVFFENSFVGIISKLGNYKGFNVLESLENEVKRKSWDESLEILWSFLLENKRLPASSGKEEEVHLYRFYANQKRDAKFGRLKAEQKIKFNYLEDYIINSNFPSTEWFKSYEKYKEFFLTNRRSPIPSRKEENKFYIWRRSQLKALEQAKLSDIQIQLLQQVEII